MTRSTNCNGTFSKNKWKEDALRWKKLRKKHIQICSTSKILKHETNVLLSDIKDLNLLPACGLVL